MGPQDTERLAQQRLHFSVAALNLNWRGFKLRAGSSKKLAELSHFRPVQAAGFEVLEVWELLDCSLHALPAHGLKDSEKTGNVLVPCSDLTHKVRHGTLGPKTTLVIHFDIEAHGLGFIEQSDHREMAPQKILDAAALEIAAVLDRKSVV